MFFCNKLRYNKTVSCQKKRLLVWRIVAGKTKQDKNAKNNHHK
jgi:hypothetical protein